MQVSSLPELEVILRASGIEGILAFGVRDIQHNTFQPIVVLRFGYPPEITENQEFMSIQIPRIDGYFDDENWETDFVDYMLMAEYLPPYERDMVLIRNNMLGSMQINVVDFDTPPNYDQAFQADFIHTWVTRYLSINTNIIIDMSIEDLSLIADETLDMNDL